MLPLMADSPKIGKCALIYSLLLFLFASCGSVSSVYIISDSLQVGDDVPGSKDHENYDDATAVDPHQVQLDRLEQLVRNLGEIVARLESRLPKSSAQVVPLIEKQTHEEDSGLAPPPLLAEGVIHRGEADVKSSIVELGNEASGRAVSVTKYSPFWTERFQFVSAVRLDSDATCIEVFPFRDQEGNSKYVAIGDGTGRVYIFHRNGDVALEFQTASTSPITAMLSYLSVYKNESLLVTGHEDGVILLHRVWEQSNGEEWSSLHMESSGRCDLPDAGEVGYVISILEVHHVGRIRYILSVDVSGMIRVFRENGALYGSAVTVKRPLAFLKQRLLFLTEGGAGSLDLRTMKIKESECEGMNNTVAKSYVFDAAERSKAYGLTSEGDLIHLLLLGDIMNFKCRVRSKRKLDMAEPLVFHSIKGYLLIVNQEKVAIFNVSSQHYVRAGAPRLLFFASLDEIRSSFLNYQLVGENTPRRRVVPLVASDREKLVILSLGDGYVGTYRSNLPTYKSEYGTILWTSPVLFFILFLLGAWQFFAKKKEALTSWGPEDPFSSTPAANGAPTGSGSGGDRPFAEPSRNADMVDLRAGGLRGPARRYPSPSQYPTGAANSFRPGSADHNPRLAPADHNPRLAPADHNPRLAPADHNPRVASADLNPRIASADLNPRIASADHNPRVASADHNPRLVSADPNFRTASELKFRGSNIESTGFQKRREGLYTNSQVVDDGS